MTQKKIVLVAALSGFLAVAIGAFGAHALKAQLTMNGRSDTYELAVRYQFYHTLALLAVGILLEKFPALRTAFYFFVAGIIIFSGSLYILSFTNQSLWGAVTPIGGIALIAGWLSFAYIMLKKEDRV